LQNLTYGTADATLTDLDTALRAHDQASLGSSSSPQTVALAIFLRRQSWISGIPLFVDAHIANASSRPLKRLDVQLERAILLYGSHAAPLGGARSHEPDHARAPRTVIREIVARQALRTGEDGWSGVAPRAHVQKTCHLTIPTGLASIDGMLSVECDPHLTLDMIVSSQIEVIAYLISAILLISYYQTRTMNDERSTLASIKSRELIAIPFVLTPSSSS